MVLEGLQPVGGRYEAYLGTGAEAKKAGLEAGRQRDNRVSSRVQISTRLPLGHKAAVPIQTLAAPRLNLLCSLSCATCTCTLWSRVFCICDGKLRTTAVD